LLRQTNSLRRSQRVRHAHLFKVLPLHSITVHQLETDFSRIEDDFR
jgi:hypothetical protein